jgi:hypothetical protein
MEIPLQPSLKGIQQIQSEKVASSLQKPIESIFPITFVSPFVFSNGVQLKGGINLVPLELNPCTKNKQVRLFEDRLRRVQE